MARTPFSLRQSTNLQATSGSNPVSPRTCAKLRPPSSQNPKIPMGPTTVLQDPGSSPLRHPKSTKTSANRTLVRGGRFDCLLDHFRAKADQLVLAPPAGPLKKYVKPCLAKEIQRISQPKWYSNPVFPSACSKNDCNLSSNPDFPSPKC